MVRHWFKKVAALALVGGGLAWGGAAHAVPISGQFSLFNDDDEGITFDPNELLSTGTFTTDSNVEMDAIEINGVLFDTVGIASLRLIDQTGGRLPSFIFPDDPDTTFPNANRPLVAVLDNDDPNTILGLEGVLSNGGQRPNARVEFFVNSHNNDGNAIVASFILSGNNRVEGRFGDSGIQVIPEPSALALLGVGLVAFGVARRRRVGVSSAS